MDDGAVISSSDGDRRAVGMPGPGGAAPGAAEPGAAASDGTVLTTARLRLSPVAAHELEELFALHADPRAFAEDATAPLTEKEQMRWVLAQWRESWDRHGVGYLSLRARRPAAPPGPGASPREQRPDLPEQAAGLPEDAAGLPEGLLGVVGLTPLRDRDEGAVDEGEAGEDDPGESAPHAVLSAYWRLAPAVHGLGLASEAMTAVLAHPVLGGGGAEILAVTASQNAPSRALAQRLGFRPAPPGRPVPGGREGDVLLVRPGTRWWPPTGADLHSPP